VRDRYLYIIVTHHRNYVRTMAHKKDLMTIISIAYSNTYYCYHIYMI